MQWHFYVNRCTDSCIFQLFSDYFAETLQKKNVIDLSTADWMKNLFNCQKSCHKKRKKSYVGILNINMKFTSFRFVIDYSHTKIVSTNILHVFYGDTILQFFYIHKIISYITNFQIIVIFITLSSDSV